MGALAAYAQGYEAFAKYCLRYGTIIKDTRTEDDGHHIRKYVISVDGWKAHITKHNGETINACLEGA
jgi:hypothetical protein